MSPRTLFTLLFTTVVTSLCAQGTLQFSRAILVSSAQTVPAGKVWKITNYLPNGAPVDTGISMPGFGATNFWARIIKINGTNVFADHAFMAAFMTATYPATNNLQAGGPIWLPEGTTLQAHSGVFAVSVLEFNILP
jgi:hypothetical protein